MGKYVDKDDIDVSTVGLAFSLEIFKRRKLNGTLQAKLHRVPGMPRDCTVSLQIIDGIAGICQVTEKSGQISALAANSLIKLDTERGPFEWILHLSPPLPGTRQMSPGVGPYSQLSPTTYTNNPNAPLPGQSGISDPVTSSSGQNSNPSLILPTSVPLVVAPLQWGQLNVTHQQQLLLYQVWQEIDGQKTIGEIKLAVKQVIASQSVDEIIQIFITLRFIRIINK